MNTRLFSFLVLAFVIVKIQAQNYPTSKLSLGLLYVKNKGLQACLLDTDTDTYVNVFRDSTLNGVNHFLWKESGFKSDVKFYNSGYILNLICLKNGKYLIVTSDPEYYDNFTFTFFDNNGEKTHSFEFNDTNIYVSEIFVEETANGNLLAYSTLPSDTYNYTGYVYILNQNGATIARKEIPFNIPEGAAEQNNPISWIKMKAFADNSNNVYLVTYNADWEKNLSQSLTAYFPKNVYYNISILDQTLSTIAGPIKKYSGRANLQFFMDFSGGDKFMLARADFKEKTLNATFYSTDLTEKSSDYIKIDASLAIWVRALSTSDNGFVLFGQGDKVMQWQKYYSNELRKGSFVKLNSTYLYHCHIKLKNEDDFGLIYSEADGNELFFTRASNFVLQIKSANILKIISLIFSIFIYTLL